MQREALSPRDPRTAWVHPTFKGAECRTPKDALLEANLGQTFDLDTGGI